MKFTIKNWSEPVMTTAQIKELINRRRRQVLVHSVIYYKLNDNLIDDATWSKWALELEELQNQYPKISAGCLLAKEFENFDHSTGMSLPLDNLWAVHTAQYLLSIARETQCAL
nr:MAG TPA: NAD-dependent DNA ligase (contains BRCT domain type II) [Caudoviricetes sp.]